MIEAYPVQRRDEFDRVDHREAEVPLGEEFDPRLRATIAGDCRGRDALPF
jgi:hypothetical protein